MLPKSVSYAMTKSTDIFSRFGKPNEIVLFTANNCLDQYGHLIMGAGCAKQAKRLMPEAPLLFGKAIKHFHKSQAFGLLAVINYPIGAFQTKFDWRKPSSLSLIEFSCSKLAKRAELWPHINFHLPYPGIGLGGLSEERVEPIINKLPNNVHIWTLRGER